jgi:undecaprenyl diphosphate synthase
MPFHFAKQSSLHVAVIPDGNGRWATARGLPRTAGHRAGVDAVRRTVEAAPGLGIGTLTLHTFSCDNWRRPEAEVRAILACVGELLVSETPACARNGVRVSVIGRRDRLPADVLAAVERAEAATVRGGNLHLRLALDYSARDAIVGALAGVPPDRKASRLDVARSLGSDVDLLVRAGGEQRLGDFLLWECAYAELVFVPTPWPEFGADDLAAAVVEFHRRERRFGGLPRVPAGGAPP